jgi:hypothetical protein
MSRTSPIDYPILPLIMPQADELPEPDVAKRAGALRLALCLAGPALLWMIIVTAVRSI